MVIWVQFFSFVYRNVAPELFKLGSTVLWIQSNFFVVDDNGSDMNSDMSILSNPCLNRSSGG